jgi:hypothetical protein
MPHSRITSPVTLPFDEYRWLWASWTPREIFKSPEVWMRVLFVLSKYEGLPYNIQTSTGRQLHNELISMGLTDENGNPISFATSDRSFLRGYQAYWTNTGVLIPPALTNDRISLTPLGRAVARGVISFSQYARFVVQRFQLPNYVTQYNESSRWINAGVRLKPLVYLLSVLVELFRKEGFQQSYLTEKETAAIVVPLAHSFSPSEVADELLAFRHGDQSFNPAFLYSGFVSRPQEFRNIKEYLQFLAAGEFLVLSKCVVPDLDLTGQVFSVTKRQVNAYFLNLFGVGRWQQFSVQEDIVSELERLLTDPASTLIVIPDPTLDMSQQRLEYISRIGEYSSAQRTTGPSAYSGNVDDYVELLLETKQIILSGPPGTGKTRLALEIVSKLNERGVLGQHEMIVFHQSYSYEDFIEGIRPGVSSSSLTYMCKDGVFKLLCNKAVHNRDKYYVLIIDEINRGNISNIFGELIFLLEPAYRDPTHTVELLYTGEPFWVPPNVLIIGTMNSTDKSAVDVDIALRRRFSVIPILPSPDILRNEFTRRGIQIVDNDGNPLEIAQALQSLNQLIARDIGLGPDYQIGHAFFMPTNDGFDDARLAHIWNYKIVPLLNEYIRISPLFATTLREQGFTLSNGILTNADIAEIKNLLRTLIDSGDYLEDEE